MDISEFIMACEVMKIKHSDYIPFMTDKKTGMTLIPSSTAIIKNERGQILLQDHVRSGCWTFPGGKTDEGESAYETVVREIYEETKIRIKSAELLYEYKFPFHYKEESVEYMCIDSLFLVTRWIGIPTIVEPKKCKELRWMHINEMRKLTNVTNTLEHFLRSNISI